MLPCADTMALHTLKSPDYEPVIDRGNGDNGAYGRFPYGLPDKLGLADFISRQPPGKVGVFFICHAGLYHMAAVGRVVFFSHGL